MLGLIPGTASVRKHMKHPNDKSAHVQTERPRGEDPGDMAYLCFYVPRVTIPKQKWHPEMQLQGPVTPLWVTVLPHW